MTTISHVFISSVGKGVWTGVYHDYRISLAYNKTVNSFGCIGKKSVLMDSIGLFFVYR